MKILISIFLILILSSNSYAQCYTHELDFSDGIKSNSSKTYFRSLGCNDKNQCDFAKITASSNKNSEVLFTVFYCKEKNKCEKIGHPVLVLPAKGASSTSVQTAILHSQKKATSDIFRINLHGAFIYSGETWSLKLNESSTPSQCYQNIDTSLNQATQSKLSIPAKNTPELNPRFDRPDEVNLKDFKRP